MKLLVLGATGATGKLVVEQTLAQGHDVAALVRSPQKLTITSPRLQVIKGDATDPSAVAAAMDGADALITTLGATKGSVITQSTRAILAAARQQRHHRVVMLSSFAVQRERLRPLAKLVTRMAIGSQIKDKTVAENELRASDLDWTIVHASVLTNGPKTGSAAVLPETTKRGLSQKISRADVAAWLVDAATGGGHGQHNVALAGSARARR